MQNSWCNEYNSNAMLYFKQSLKLSFENITMVSKTWFNVMKHIWILGKREVIMALLPQDRLCADVEVQVGPEGGDWL